MRLLHRATGWTVIFLYTLGWRWFLPVTLPALLAGVLGAFLVIDLPLTKSIPAAVMLAGLVAIAWRQWDNAEGLRERLLALQEQMEETEFCDYEPEAK